MNTLSSDDLDPNALTIEQALEQISEELNALDRVESIAVDTSLGRVIAHTVKASSDIPQFRASAMDGYAFRHCDANKTLSIIGKSLAGHPADDALASGECVRITTGAKVPEDADTVVQQENVSVHRNRVTINLRPNKGHHIRPAGSDQARGSTLLHAGAHIGPAALALLTSQGIGEITVQKPLRVGVFSTGDELRTPPDGLLPGQIYDANRPLLLSLLDGPAIEATDLGIANDTPEGIISLLKHSDEFDLMISTGGVSVGDADFVRSALSSHGSINLWKIAIKPGRPLTFGRLDSGTPFFGLPGNPVSAAVTFVLFIQPALRQLLNRPPLQLLSVEAIAESGLTKLRGRVEYQRGSLTQKADGTFRVSTTGLQDSHMVTSLHQANCLVKLNADSTGCSTGELVSVVPLSQFTESIY